MKEKNLWIRLYVMQGFSLELWVLTKPVLLAAYGVYTYFVVQ